MTYPTILRTRKETRLCYYTAWQQTQPRDYTKPTAREVAQVKEAVILITLLASLNIYIYDLIDEMEAIGKYRHANKRKINQAKDIIMKAHDTIFRRIRSLNEQGSRDYNDAMDAFYGAIEECKVSLVDSESLLNLWERFLDIIARKGFPTRRARFCCEVL